ncbi:MAG: 50S ribosomal protein L31e [Candidatus Micrarchaeota archaeon]|nr:50S ribosomal protein L31e [Candidatus Micrarchaeota archaeon]
MEKIMIANLKKAYEKPRTKRRMVVIKLLKEIVARHSKSDYLDVKIDNEVTKELYKNGSRFPLKKIKIKITKDEKSGVVVVTLPEASAKKDEKAEKSKKEEKKKQENKEEKGSK